jgi:hypothetical protein
MEEKQEVHHIESLPHTTESNPRHKFVYQPPPIRNEHDKGDVEVIEEPITTMSTPIITSSPTISPFHEDCTVHISTTKLLVDEKMFTHDESSNHVGNKELNAILDVGNKVLKEKEIKKQEKEVSKVPKRNGELERKIDEWSKAQNSVSSKQNSMTNPPPSPHIENVNDVFTRSGKSDDSSKNQKGSPPVFVFNKFDQAFKITKKDYHMVKSKVSPSLMEYIPNIPYPQRLRTEIPHLNHTVKVS